MHARSKRRDPNIRGNHTSRETITHGSSTNDCMRRSRSGVFGAMREGRTVPSSHAAATRCSCASASSAAVGSVANPHTGPPYESIPTAGVRCVHTHSFSSPSSPAAAAPRKPRVTLAACGARGSCWRAAKLVDFLPHVPRAQRTPNPTRNTPVRVLATAGIAPPVLCVVKCADTREEGRLSGITTVISRFLRVAGGREAHTCGEQAAPSGAKVSPRERTDGCCTPPRRAPHARPRLRRLVHLQRAILCITRPLPSVSTVLPPSAPGSHRRPSHCTVDSARKANGSGWTNRYVHPRYIEQPHPACKAARPVRCIW